jgi:hypothetical protein
VADYLATYDSPERLSFERLEPAPLICKSCAFKRRTEADTEPPPKSEKKP